jgi:hypothetical protein
MVKNKTLSDIFTECLIRDNHTCQDCGSTKCLEVHHLLPISQGGRNKLDNLKTVCHDCHKNNYKDVHFPKDKSKIIPYELREKSRTGIDKSKYSQIMLSFPNELVDQIEVYWHENKLKNRNEAIRELVHKGLKKEQSE